MKAYADSTLTKEHFKAELGVDFLTVNIAKRPYAKCFFGSSTEKKKCENELMGISGGSTGANDDDKLTFSKEKGAKARYVVVIIPVSMEGGARGALGLEWGFLIKVTGLQDLVLKGDVSQLAMGAGVEAGPFVDLGAYLQASVDLLIAQAGVRGELSLIKDTFTGNMKVHISKDPYLSGEIKNVLDGPSGSVGPFVSWIQPRWGIPPWQEETRYQPLVEWGPVFSKTHVLLSWDTKQPNKGVTEADITDLNQTEQGESQVPEGYITPIGPPQGVDVLATIGYAGKWGYWGVWQYCPPGSFAVGYAMKVEPDQQGRDDTAVNGIKLYCANKETGEITGNITGNEGPWGSWREGINCENSAFLHATAMKFEPYQHDRDDTATNSVQFKCTDNQVIQAVGGMSWGTWGSYQTCPNQEVLGRNIKTAICGLQTRIESRQGDGDDTALNGVNYACCALEQQD